MPKQEVCKHVCIRKTVFVGTKIWITVGLASAGSKLDDTATWKHTLASLLSLKRIEYEYTATAWLEEPYPYISLLISRTQMPFKSLQIAVRLTFKSSMIDHLVSCKLYRRIKDTCDFIGEAGKVMHSWSHCIIEPLICADQSICYNVWTLRQMILCEQDIRRIVGMNRTWDFDGLPGIAIPQTFPSPWNHLWTYCFAHDFCGMFCTHACLNTCLSHISFLFHRPLTWKHLVLILASISWKLAISMLPKLVPASSARHCAN